MILYIITQQLYNYNYIELYNYNYLELYYIIKLSIFSDKINNKNDVYL